MATPNLNITQNQIKPYTFKDYPQKANGLSFWAFLFSIFIYISLFYFFNLSPSTLFNTTTFWFFISNTLIIIIAADSGAFSCSKKPDLHEDYLKHSRAISPSSFELQYHHVTKKSQPQEVGDEHPQEEKKEVAVHHENKPIKMDLKLLEEHESHKPIISSETFTEKVIQVDNAGTGQEKKMINDSAPVTNNESTIALRSSETEKHQPIEEENEFSSMSDEELNRRVEEFIQRFNRQIRLQAALRNSNQSIKRREGRDFNGV